MLYDWIKSLDFAYPAMFALLVCLPLLIVWYIKKQGSQQAAFKVSTIHAFTATSWKNRFRHLPFLLRILALACLVTALARPQKKDVQKQTQGEGIDIILCMDVSGSMGSRDIKPSRLEAAKEVAVQFVRDRPVDRIGLVVFSGESFTQCPLTTDKNTLIEQIESLESRRYLIDGTVIGEGLATAVDRLSKSAGKSKVIILLTDGKEDPPETRLIDPLTALEIAKSQKVKVYTIGMSGAPGVFVETIERQKGKKNPSADYLDEELLRKIATETGGQYFRAYDNDGLKNIYDQIDKLEKSKVEITTYTRYEERFLPFVLVALGLLFVEMLLRFIVFRKFP